MSQTDNQIILKQTLNQYISVNFVKVKEYRQSINHPKVLMINKVFEGYFELFIRNVFYSSKLDKLRKSLVE